MLRRMKRTESASSNAVASLGVRRECSVLRHRTLRFLTAKSFVRAFRRHRRRNAGDGLEFTQSDAEHQNEDLHELDGRARSRARAGARLMALGQERPDSKQAADARCRRL